MDFLKTIGGKIISGLVALAVIAAGISWWQMDESTRSTLVSGAGKIVAWILAMLFLPWATFVIIGRVARADSNAAGAALVLAYTVIEGLLLAWLFDWSISGPAGWGFVVAAVLVAGVYYLFACDWIAERVGN